MLLETYFATRRFLTVRRGSTREENAELNPSLEKKTLNAGIVVGGGRSLLCDLGSEVRLGGGGSRINKCGELNCLGTAPRFVDISLGVRGILGVISGLSVPMA